MNLIDRDEIVKVAEHAYAEWNLAMAGADGEREINKVFKMKELCKAVKAVAMAAPTVDADPVVHGKWILKHVGAGHYWECSSCHKNPCIYVTENTNFCPNCGAKMDLEV